MTKISGPEAAKMMEECSKALTGHDTYLQGAVLADLLSMWLAAHNVVGDREATDNLREDLLKHHIKAVREMIPVSEQQIIEKLLNVAAKFEKGKPN